MAAIGAISGDTLVFPELLTAKEKTNVQNANHEIA
jgi:hypothetical protein